MRKPLVAGLITAVVVVVAVAALLIGRLFRSDPSAAQLSECSIPAVAGAPVTVVVEGPQTQGPGATGAAAAGASAAATTSVVSAPDVFTTAVQLQNAATVNAVGLARGLPERARIIAVATAWQESKLRNLPGGDRDSLGLFQQRPSQGWGTAMQISDPVYAAGAFYDALLTVKSWQSLSLTRAAQSVQFSAYPDAYAQWEPNSTTLVRELSGLQSPTLSCRAGAQPPTAPAPSRAAVAGLASGSALGGVVAAAAAELGGVQVVSATGSTAVLAARVPGQSAAAAANALAAWAVAHGTGSGVTAVAVAARSWAGHAWSDGPAVPAGQVRIGVG